MSDFTPGSLAARGFRMPAEWEPHAGTWITWPHFEGTWPGKLDAVVPTYVEIVRALAPGETVHINVLDEAAEDVVGALLRLAGIEGNVRLHRIPTDNEWVRDYGAIFVTNGAGGRIATDWKFNNWGEKYPDFALDNLVPERMAEIVGTPREAFDFILEGGSIEVNGAGLLLTTEACLLNPNRNPGTSKDEIERRLRDAFGVHEILWLGDGIVGDDTDGHIDDLTRFVNRDTVVTVVEDDPADVNYEPLRENLDRLGTRPSARSTGSKSSSFRCPARSSGRASGCLPRTPTSTSATAPFCFLPSTTRPTRVARETLQRYFPDRKVTPIDCRDLVWGLGAFHCLTQQIPDATLAQR